MSIEEGAKFVAATCAMILAVVIASCAILACRVGALQRDLDLLERELEKREAAGSGD